ncbi:MAG: N-acetyl-gamma-glutamyl-phosphate reductase [Ruminococcus sp.]|jgi:N-acetyl-gamma-glutamyl-phosphate reductase|nr:N-acetyl-gamma-glutamyl-phosphate reductase [Ruminococcus sp.]
MMKKIFIDGASGTTGLKLRERLSVRQDLEIIDIDVDLRRDTETRSRMINASDVTFLCLPDDAAREAVKLCTNQSTIIIDASTAHRTTPGWAYGFPELSGRHREEIAKSKRIAVPGCYASGFVALTYPLVEEKLIQPYYPMTVNAVSGYSGAGKKGIAEYESPEKPDEYNSPRMYSMSALHKHIPEMMAKSGLSFPPIFSPMVDNFYSGMLVSIPLHTRLMAKPTTADKIRSLLSEHYKDSFFVKVMPEHAEEKYGGYLPANGLSGTNSMEIYAFGFDKHILLTARLDNLGKGASGAAVQCMNIALGLDEKTGLI